MTEGFAIALLTVLGAVATAALNAVFGRSRLNRLEAVSRVLKDLPVHDPAYANLAQVREEDAREIRRAQQSPWPVLVGFSLAAVVFGFLFSEFGDDIRERWEGIYFALLGAVVGSVLGTALLYLVFVAAWVIGMGKRLVSWIKTQWEERRGRRLVGRRPERS